MKRLVTGLVLFALMLAGGIWCLHETTSRCTQLAEMAEQTQQSLQQGDWERATEQAKLLEQQWEQDEQLLRLFLRRGGLEEIERQASGLQERLQLGDDEGAAAALAAIQTAAEHLAETEPPTLRNLL